MRLYHVINMDTTNPNIIIQKIRVWFVSSK